ncbi:IclR family transcriptional regulator [Ruania rhizosphaerae]|uniref:IclR family transcriptional regulator n=1 Tax=Ruania rhizosphaerae TaxID=1840413 RepID=UPI0013589930|nr:IclR family transcriptional regulator [Ruania rhizosphaerae]
MGQSVDRAIRALQIIAEQPLTATEAAAKLEVHTSTAFRLLQTLASHNFVTLERQGRYRLGAGLFSLAFQAWEDLDVREVASPYLHSLNDLTSETVHLAVLEQQHVVYIDKVESKHPIRMYSRVGAVAPLHCTGVAKAILAFLDVQQRRELLAHAPLHGHTQTTLTSIEALEANFAIAREQGYTLDDEEHEVGIHCIAAPVFSPRGAVAGAVSISAPMARLPRDELLKLIPALLDATSQISSELGAPAPSPQRPS